MQKIFKLENNDFVVRKSRWIQIHHDYVTKKHSLFEYADDYETPGTEGLLVWFRHKGKKYALGQFLRFNPPLEISCGNETVRLCGYDCTDYWYPYLLEINDTGEAVRLYIREREV